MIGTYASAALICAVSLLVGRAILSLAGRREWSWLEPAVGFGAVLTVTGLLARAPGPRHLVDPGAGGADRRRGAGPLARRSSFIADIADKGRTPTRIRWREGLPVALVVAPRARDPVRGQRPLGAARRRLQQRPRPAPRLGRVAAQRLRPGPGPGLPARPARAGGGDGGGAGDQPRPGLPRRDHRDRGDDRPDGPRRAARNDPRPPHPRRRPGRPPLPSRLLLRPGRLQGASRGAARPGLRDLPDDLRQPRGQGGPYTRHSTSSAASVSGVGTLLAWPPAPGPRRRHLLLLQLRRHRLAGSDPRPLEPDPAGGARGAAPARAAALPAAADDPGRQSSSSPDLRGAGHRRRPLRLRQQLQQSRRQQHLRPRLPDSRRWESGPPPTTAWTPPAAPSYRASPERSRSSPCWSASPGG